MHVGTYVSDRHVYRHDLTLWYQQVSVQNADDLFRRKERSCLNFPYKSNYVTSQEYLAFASQLVQLNCLLHMTNGCTSIEFYAPCYQWMYVQFPFKFWDLSAGQLHRST